MGLVTLGRSVCGQSLGVNKTGTIISIVADSLGNSIWELQKSTNSGTTWITVLSTQGQTRWDIPISTNEPTVIFRLKLVTTATMTVADKNYQFTPIGQSLFTGMAQLSGLTVKSQSYTGMGQFVTSLNDTVKGGGKNWILFVNGQSTTVGSSQVVPKAGDKIGWRLV
ncbi:DUF4430 domain-containing protein [Candidatus Nomurabacteria bacterium]|nr:DUF4430 domain-containing protein [Candidatus Nomurabacteria bacterium]